MNWIKDKKNLPIVAAILAVVIAGAVVFVLLNQGVIGRTAATPTTTAGTPGAPPTVTTSTSASTAMANKARGAGGIPSYGAQTYGAKPVMRTASAVPAKAGTQVVPPVVNVKHGNDPFLFSLIRRMKTTTRSQLEKSVSVTPFDSSTVSVPSLPSETAMAPEPTPVTEATNNRVSGIVQTTGVYAILESNGESKTVQPGDTVDRYKIISIQPDGVTAKSLDTGDTIHVPLSSNTTSPAGGASSFPGAGATSSPGGA